MLDVAALGLAPGDVRRVDVPIEMDPLRFGGETYDVEVADDGVVELQATSGGLYLKLHFGATVAGPCYRCLEDARVAVTVDATELSTSRIAVMGVTGQIDSRTPQQLRIGPGRYRLAIGSQWSDAYFTVTAAGKVDYDAGITYLGGRGEGTLTVHGLPLTIDATSLTASVFSMTQVLSAVSTRATHQVRVLPTRYQLSDGSKWSQAFFTVTSSGLVQYDQTVTCLSGSGTATLRTTTTTLPT